MIAPEDLAAIRFSYGRGPAGRVPGGLDDLLAEVTTAPAVPAELADMTSASRLKAVRGLRDAVDRRNPDSRTMFSGKRRELLHSSYLTDAHRKIAYAVASPHGFVERLVQFWSNHFTVAAMGLANAFAGPFEVEVVRRNLRGRFEDMLIASTLHPAMLIYLNQRASIGPNSRIGKRTGRGLNENLAREVLELHSLGADGGYTQADVTEFARLLAGATFSLRSGKFEFRETAAEPGPKTILGKTYGGKSTGVDDVVQALRDFAHHPSTARHVAKKLARHFIADDPSPQSVDTLAARFSETGGSLEAVYEVLVRLPEAAARFGEKRKTPYDFLVSALKMLSPPPDWFAPVREGSKLRPNPMTMGLLNDLDQPLWKAPSPAGWPEEAERWITPAGLAGRLEWIGKAVDRAPEAEPLAFLDQALGSAAGARTREIISNAASRRAGIALVLASAEFNSR
jgi:uncharacterized protein (DUF1800 family)